MFTGGLMCGSINPFFYFIMKLGWIKLHRNIMDWEWYSDITTRGIFIHCLLRANHSNTKWRGIELEKGQFVTSYKKLAEENGVSLQTVRTHIKRLIKSGNLTIKTTNKFTIVTVCNYSVWQDSENENNTQTNIQTTRKQHSKNIQLTTDKNEKNDNNEITIHNQSKNFDFNEKSSIKKADGRIEKEKKVAAKKENADFVFPEVEEVDVLKNYFTNRDTIAFFAGKYPLLSIETEFESIYTALQKKAANGNAQLANPYSYVKTCLENAERKRQQRVSAQKSTKFNGKRKSTAKAEVSDWSTGDFWA
jgi:DNA-binding transcriptional regulator YhcF (GntR family)